MALTRVPASGIITATTFTFNSISVTGTNVTSSTATGAVTIAGGLGVGGNAYFGGTITATNFVGSFSGTVTGTASSATYATNASTATYAQYASSSTYGTYASSSTYGTYASSSTYATYASSATYATSAGNAATANKVNNAHTTGTGILGSTFDGSAAVTWSLNTSTLMANAVTAINLAGGSANQFAYQTGAGATSFMSTGSMYVYRATVADSASGSAGSVAFSHSTGTGILGATYNGSAAVTWSLNTSTLMSSSTYATNASTATYAQYASSSTYGTYASSSTYSQYASSATYATNASSSTYAQYASSATYATNASSSTYATYASSSTYGTYASSSTYAQYASSATYAAYANVAQSVTNSVTFNNSNTGDASGTAYNGSAARTISANTLGALSLASGGTVSGPVTFSGPITFSNTATYVSSTNTFYTDNIIELHTPAGGPGVALTSDDGKDIGVRFHYYSGADANAALVLANDTKWLEWYSNGAEGTSTFAGSAYGTFKTGNIYTTQRMGVGSNTTTVFSGLFPGQLSVVASGNIDAIIAKTDSAAANAAAGVFHQSSTTPGFDAFRISTVATSNSQAALNILSGVTDSTGLGGSSIFYVRQDGYTGVGVSTQYSGEKFSVNGGAYFNSGIVTATTFVGNLTGTASSATYATYAGNAATANKVNNAHSAGTGLTGTAFDGSAAVTWTLNTATLMNIAVNLTGGAAGSLVYQSAANATTNLAIGTSGYVLTSNGSAPTWSAASGITAGSAGSVTNALTINNAGSGAASGSTYNGSSAVTISYNSVGAPGAGWLTDSGLTRQGNSFYSADTRSTNYAPGDRAAGLYADFKANSTDSLSDGGTYHGVLTFRSYGTSNTDFTGGIAQQIAYTDNSNLWHRGSASSSTWGTWYKVIDTGNTSTAMVGTAVSAISATNLSAGSAMAVPYQSASGTTAYLAAGTSGYVLQTNGTGSAPSWVAQSSIAAGSAPLTNTYVGYGSGSNLLTGSSGLTYASSILNVSYQNTFNTTTPGTGTYGIHLNGQSTNDYATGITFSAGSASAGSAHSGIYSQGSGSYGTKMYFATTDSYASGAKTRMMIDYTGNVGVGTTSPPNKLTVSNGGAMGLEISPTAGYTGITGVDFLSYDRSASSYGGFGFITNSSNNSMVILNSGNVGIANTAPDAKLRVDGNVMINGEGNGVMVDTSTAALARVGLMKYGGYEGMLIAGTGTVLRLGHRTDSAYVYGGTPTIREDLTITSAGAISFNGSYGTSGQILQSNGNTAPTWVNQSSIAAGSAPLTSTYVGFGSGSNLLTGSSTFTWNGSSLFVNTSSDNGSTTIGSARYNIQVGPGTSRGTTANSYYGGIAFNHLLNYSGTTYNNSPQAWIGARLFDTTGSERDCLVFATKPGTGTTGSGNDLPIERMCIDPNGLVLINSTTSSDAGSVKLYVNNGSNGWPVTSGTTQTYGALRLKGGDNAVLDFGMNSTNTWLQATDKSGLNNFYAINLNPQGGNVIIGQGGISYSSSDNTAIVGSINANKLHVNGSIQLTNDNDAIVIGRGTGSFFKDEELGFGWGGGWYMTDATYLRVRNAKTIYSADGEIDLRNSGATASTNRLYFNVNNGGSGGTSGYNYGSASAGGTTLGTGIVWAPSYSGYSKRSAGILNIAEGNYFRSGLAFYTNNITDSTTDWTEAMRIGSNGNVQIGGGSSPSLTNKFEVDGSNGQLFSVTDSFTGTIFSANDISGIPSIEVLDTGLVKFAQYNGSVAISTSTAVSGSALSVYGIVSIVGTSGELRASSEITAYYSSDARLKENISVISDPIEILTQINGVYFDWTDEHIARRGGEDGFFVRKHDIGVIAQEVEAVLPEIVATREDGYKAVKYEKIVPLLIEAVKSQQQTIDLLKAELQEIKDLIKGK